MDRKSKFIFLWSGLWLCICLPAYAQINTFKYKAEVKKIDSSDVYRIELSPELIAKSEASLQDIRLMDAKGKNVAFVLSDKLKFTSPDRFMVFPSVYAAKQADTAVFFIAENKNKLNINRLWIRLRNTGVSRTVNLSGSDDMGKWFAIMEDIPLQEAGAGGEADYLQTLDFPTSNYRYLKIQVSGKNKTPVKILQAGIYTAVLNVPSYAAIPPVKFISKDSAQKTTININLKDAYLVNKLHLVIDGPKYYSRRIVVTTPGEQGDTNVADTVISSAGSGEILLSVKSKKLQINIYNGDDNPLIVRVIEGCQLKQFAVAYLEAHKRYQLLTGSTNAKIVDYDLSFLNGRAYNQLPGINHLALRINPSYAIPHNLTPSNNTIWLWAAIIIVLLILCLLTFKMTREIRRG